MASSALGCTSARLAGGVDFVEFGSTLVHVRGAWVTTLLVGVVCH